MISISDFFPAHAQKQLTAQEREKIGSDVGSSVLLLDLPLRYTMLFTFCPNVVYYFDGEKNTHYMSNHN